MKKTIPAKEIEVCDICHREDTLSECQACGIQHCYGCRGIVPGCIHDMYVCKLCEKKESVIAISKKYVPHLLGVLKKRILELRALRGETEQ